MNTQKINLQVMIDGYIIALRHKCKVDTIDGVEYADQFPASTQLHNYAAELVSDFCRDAAVAGHLNYVAENQESIGFMLVQSQQNLREMFELEGKPELEMAARANLRATLYLNDLGWLQVTW